MASLLSAAGRRNNLTIGVDKRAPKGASLRRLVGSLGGVLCLLGGVPVESHDLKEEEGFLYVHVEY